LLRVYRPSLATWYGPGFYGNRTACGRILRTTTVGVAHRTLPCGTKVSILYGGRAIRVPVIDRGPYSSARWDLTSRTAQLIGFSGRNTIGIMR
jgi:rare lipoprotein A